MMNIIMRKFCLLSLCLTQVWLEACPDSDHGQYLAPTCYWTGGIRLANGNWTWSNVTEPIQTYYWEVGAPNISQSQEAAICRRYNGSSIEWNVLNKSSRAYYICERESSLIINGTKLIFYNNFVNYTTANATCTMLNGNLVNVKTNTTQQAIREKILEWINSDPLFWIRQKRTYKMWSGGYRDDEGTWRWSEGIPIRLRNHSGTSFQKWGLKDPNYNRSSTIAIALVFSNKKSGIDDIWYDEGINRKFTFICQIDINECNVSNNCSANANCHNNYGSYTCSCQAGYIGDGILCEDSCAETSIMGRNFPTTNLNRTTYAIEPCPSGIPSASIRCEKTRVGSIDRAMFNNASMHVYNCSADTLLNLSSEGQVFYFGNLLTRVNSSNASVTEALDSLSLLLKSTGGRSNISIDLFLTLLELLSDMVQNVSSYLSKSQRQYMVHLLSLLTRYLQLGKDSVVTKDTRSFMVEVSTFSGNVVPMRSRVFTPIYTNQNGKVVQPVSLNLSEKAFLEESSEDEMNGNNTVITDRRSAFILYKSNVLFPTTFNNNITVVLSAELGRNAKRRSLSKPLSLRFNDIGALHGIHRNSNDTLHKNRTSLRCVFWDFNTTSWSDEGCFLNLTSNPPECLCNHLTNFALIVTTETTLSDVALDVVSMIGSVLSIAGLLFTIIIHALSRESRKFRPAKIILNVCSNLLVAYVIFVVGVSQTSNKTGCDVVAMLLHYFLLTSWCWMVVYSYDIYMSLVKVFRQSQKQFLQKVSLFAYGIPALIVSITAGITLGYVDKSQPNHLYNSEPDPVATSSYRSDAYCWLQLNSLHFGFLTPVGIMLVFNIFVLISVFREIYKKRESRSSPDITTKESLGIALTMTSMMGITWLLGYFVLLTRVPLYVTITSWLFTIFNTLQGFLIFFLTAVRQKTLRKVWLNPISNCTQRIANTISTSQSSPQDFASVQYSK